MAKKLLAFLSAFLIVSSIACAEISAQRIVASGIAPGDEASIAIRLDLGGEAPSAIIVTERIPEGWNVTGSDPAAEAFDGKIKWLIYGGSMQENITLAYNMTAPETFSEDQLLVGEWKTLQQSGFVLGDLHVPRLKPAIGAETQAPLQAQEEQQPAAQQAAEIAASSAAQNNVPYIIGGAAIVMIAAIAIIEWKREQAG